MDVRTVEGDDKWKKAADREKWEEGIAAGVVQPNTN